MVIFAGTLIFYRCGKSQPQTDNQIYIGVACYDQKDTFIEELVDAFKEQCSSMESKDYAISMTIMDASNSQRVQNDQIEQMINDGCNVLCVNLADRTEPSEIIDAAKEKDIPIIFFNREPVAEDMNRWEKLYYVGADAKESAVLEGQILVDAYKKNPSSLDRNGDGVVSYVLLEGETNHQDSLIRTEWSIQTLKDGGVPIRRITGGIANWEKNQASALMEQWLSEYGTEIELVIANNDDMALGAIDAIERAGIVTGTIKLVGIDGTPAGQDAFREGKLFGTVESSKEIYAKRIFDTAEELAMGKEVTQEKYFWSPQQMIAN